MKKIIFIMAYVLCMLSLSAQTRIAMKVNDLPYAITANLQSQHEGWIATEAFKVNTRGVMTYDVLVKKGNSEAMLVYDKDGKYLKMEPKPTASGSTSKSSASSPAKKDPAMKK